MDKNVEGERITLKRRRPNPLFEDWLEELYAEAKSKKSKLESKLKEALDSLSKYPLPLETGAECAVLKGFDKNLCVFLDKRLKVYNDNEESSMSSSGTASRGGSSQHESGNTKSVSVARPKKSLESSQNSSSKKQTTSNDSEQPKSNGKVSKSRKEYKPVFRSGSYAILVALLEHLRDNPNHPGLKKAELIEKAQPHSEESFVRPKPESFYTAWSNMSRLVSKGLVTQVRSKTTIYSLTDDGAALAIQLLEDAKNTPTVNDIIFNEASSNCTNKSTDTEVKKLSQNSQSSSSLAQSSGSINTVISQSQSSNSEVICVELPPDSFEVILLIDVHETSGSSNKKKTDPTVAQFNKFPDLKNEYRSLKVGDFTWIARHKVKTDQELVLPYIVERKRMDDLGHSIKDGRYHEQKFRLRKCGLPNIIYLVEHFGSDKHVGLPMETLMQALANTRAHDDFKVHITDSLTTTVRFLAMMTKRLTIEYKDKTLIGMNTEPQGDGLMTFNYFNKSSLKTKPLTVAETFIKLLLQLKGVSVEKALAIAKVYNTPQSLIKQYENCSQKEGELLLASLKYGNLTRNVGPVISKTIYKFFTWKE